LQLKLNQLPLLPAAANPINEALTTVKAQPKPLRAHTPTKLNLMMAVATKKENISRIHNVHHANDIQNVAFLFLNKLIAVKKIQQEQEAGEGNEGIGTASNGHLQLRVL